MPYSRTLLRRQVLRVNAAGISFPLRFYPGLKFKTHRKWDELATLRLKWQRNSSFSKDEYCDLIFVDGGAARLHFVNLNPKALEQLFHRVRVLRFPM